MMSRSSGENIPLKRLESIICSRCPGAWRAGRQPRSSPCADGREEVAASDCEAAVPVLFVPESNAPSGPCDQACVLAAPAGGSKNAAISAATPVAAPEASGGSRDHFPARAAARRETYPYAAATNPRHGCAAPGPPSLACAAARILAKPWRCARQGEPSRPSITRPADIHPVMKHARVILSVTHFPNPSQPFTAGLTRSCRNLTDSPPRPAALPNHPEIKIRVELVIFFQRLQIAHRRSLRRRRQSIVDRDLVIAFVNSAALGEEQAHPNRHQHRECRGQHRTPEPRQPACLRLGHLFPQPRLQAHIKIRRRLRRTPFIQQRHRLPNSSIFPGTRRNPPDDPPISGVISIRPDAMSGIISRISSHFITPLPQFLFALSLPAYHFHQNECFL